MRLSARVKNLLRPLVFNARRARLSLEGRLRPPRRWDGRHDPVLLRFEPWHGQSDGRFSYDFLGVRTDPVFRPQIKPEAPGTLATEYPHPQYEYVELVFVLESVVDAARAGSMTIMELGAGYGKWLAVAHHAARRLAVDPVRLIGVEMVPRHFSWMGEHLKNNGIDPSAHRLIHAAVSDRDGEAWYQPEPDASTAYGQRVFRRGVAAARAIPGEPDPKEPRRRDTAGNASLDPVRVPCIALSGLLRSVESVDLVHCDIQGEELRAIGTALDELTRKARRVVVGTHSRKIHRRLRELMMAAGWECRWDFTGGHRRRTPYGDLFFLDGVLAFVNRSPRLRTPA